jgi:endonuclease YncB( thermonuclease family)
MIKMFKIPTFLTALVIFAAGASAQSKMVGQVVDAVDGKTVVLEVDGRRLIAELQYIEVPDAEQPLHQTVRDHLRKLTVGSTAEFRPNGFAPGKAFGRLYAGSGDVAVQMLRDGAAWHLPPAASGQDAAVSEEYRRNEEQARAERRGVWGVAGMKPAWEFRAEKAEQQRLALAAAERAATEAWEAENKIAAAAKQPAKRTGPWADKNPWLKDPGPLVHGYNAASKTGFLGTSLMGVREADPKADRKTAIDVSYVYTQVDERSRKGKFILTVISSADEHRFLKSNDLVLTVDEKKFPFGRPKRDAERQDGKALERLTYQLEKAAVEKIVFGGDVTLKIGDYVFHPSQGLQLLLYNMLQAAQ